MTVIKYKGRTRKVRPPKPSLTKKKKKQIINAMPTTKDWSWNPKAGDIPKAKFKNAKKQKHSKGKSGSKLNNNLFYASDEWRRLRYRVIRNNDGCCCACGRSKKNHGIVIHVDHIKPRSKYPSLELTYENMQILCEDCNMGKSNIDETDWRSNDNGENAILINAMARI